MNAVLFKSMTYNRALLIVAGFLIAGWMRLAVVLTKGGDSSESLMWTAIVCFYLFAPMLAAFLGSEFSSAGAGGWAWLLARPVARGQMLYTRAIADLVTILVLSLVLELLMGPQTPAVWALTLLLWIGFHGITAWAASFGLQTLAALGVGLLWGILGLAAGLLGAWAGLAFESPSALLETVSQAKQAVPGAPPLETFWFLAAAPAFGFAASATLGWWNAAGHIRVGPRPLELRRVGLHAGVVLILVVVLGAATSAIVARPGADVPMYCDYYGVSFLKDDLVMHGIDLYGRSEIRRYDTAGNMRWRGSARERCTFNDSKKGVTAIACGSRLFVFDEHSVEPKTIDFDGVKAAWWLVSYQPEILFELAPDGKRLVYTKDGTLDHYIIHLDQTDPSSADSSLEPQLVGTGNLGRLAAWGNDNVLRFVQAKDSHWILNLIRDDGTQLDPIALTEAGDDRATVNVEGRLNEDVLLFRIDQKGTKETTHLVVWPDGRSFELPLGGGRPQRYLGTTPDGTPIFGTWTGEEHLQVWRVPLEGTPALMGELEVQGKVLSLAFSPDGSSAIAQIYNQQDGMFMAGLNEGHIDQGTVFPTAFFWDYHLYGRRVTDAGIQVTWGKGDKQIPKVALLPWPHVPPFLPPTAPSPEPLEPE